METRSTALGGESDVVHGAAMPSSPLQRRTLTPAAVADVVCAVNAVFADRSSDEIGRSIDSAEYGAMQSSLVYGEVAVEAMATLLIQLCQSLAKAPSWRRDDVPWRFFDLGSGEGLPVVVAAATRLPFVDVVGIELVTVSTAMCAAACTARLETCAVALAHCSRGLCFEFPSISAPDTATPRARISWSAL